MKRTFIVLLVVALCVTGLGFYRGWIVLSSPSRDTESHKVNVNVTVAPDKVKEDAGKVKDKTTELAGKVTEQAKEYGDQARDKVKPDDQ